MRAYDLLLRLYPASFRAEYAPEMRRVFALARRDCRGPAAVAAFWAAAIADVGVNAGRVHWDILLQDVRHSCRALKRSPGFTATAIVLAALGTGAVTATFSLADHVLIRPIRFPEPERLVALWQDQSFRGYPQMELSPGNYRDWRRMSQSFEEMAGYTELSGNLVGAGEPARLEAALVSGGFFAVLRARPAIGRPFTETDDRESSPRTVILSDALWRSRFGGEIAALGRKILLDGHPHTVIGVMPPRFDFPSRDTQYWATFRFAPDAFEDRSNTYLNVVARLKRDVTLEQAGGELKRIASRLEREFPKDNARTGATIMRLADTVPRRTRSLLIALAGASVCVLLIACTNLAALLLTRASARQREIAIRAAIGGGRERIVRQMLTESLLLASAGGAAGGVLAVAATPFASRLIPATLPIAETPQTDLRMLAFAAVVTMATGLAFGLVPALRSHRSADAASLREAARVTAGRSTQRVRGALIVAQIAATIVLLIACGLLIRALVRVQQTDPGFTTQGVLTVQTSLPFPKYDATARREQFYGRVLDEVRRLPGVTSAAYVTSLPMVWRGGIWAVTPGTAPPVEDATETRTASLRQVTPGFFQTIGVPIRMGRDISASDTRERESVAVVSESFARQLWPGESPIGRQFFMAFLARRVVGVVGDIRVRGLERTSEPQVYISSQQLPDGALTYYAPKALVVRTAGSTNTLAPFVRQIVARADPQQPVSDIRPLADIVAAETEARVVQVRVLGAFAVMSFVLAAVGIHGLLAFSVSMRTQEIGLRVALGATPGRVLTTVIGRAVVLAGAGVALGLFFGAVAARAMSGLLAGVSAKDPLTFATVVVLAVVMTSMGALATAIRALRLDPTIAMRAE
jgi:putative ABC transport system permease protein